MESGGCSRHGGHGTAVGSLEIGGGRCRGRVHGRVGGGQVGVGSEVLEQLLGRAVALSAVTFTAIHPIANVRTRAVGCRRRRGFMSLEKLGVTRRKARGH